MLQEHSRGRRGTALHRRAHAIDIAAFGLTSLYRVSIVLVECCCNGGGVSVADLTGGSVSNPSA
jgi:hypothetical protein